MNVKKLSIKTEKNLANKLGMKATKNSGALLIKGDMQDDLFILEHKLTFAKYPKLPKSWFIKLQKEAVSATKTPVLCLQNQFYDAYFLFEDDYDHGTAMGLITMNPLVYYEGKASVTLKIAPEYPMCIKFGGESPITVYGVSRYDFENYKKGRQQDE